MWTFRKQGTREVVKAALAEVRDRDHKRQKICDAEKLIAATKVDQLPKGEFENDGVDLQATGNVNSLVINAHGCDV